MTMSRSRCIEPHQRIDQVMNEVEDLELEGLTYAAGCGIDPTDLASGTITIAVDGSTVVCNDGVLSAVAASDLVAGCGIVIATGTVSVAHDGTLDCVEGLLTVVDNPQNVFTSVVVSGQDTVTVDSPTTALTLAAGSNITLTTNNTTKTVTIASSGGGGGGTTEPIVHGRLATDLTSTMSSVSVTVEHYTGSNPGSSITALNPEDTIRPDVPDGETRYLFIGNEGGFVKASQIGSDWRLEIVQSPVQVPVAP